MKTTIKLLTLLILVTFSSCENTAKIEYKYAENPKLLACEITNGDLYKEAIYAFENDIVNTYDIKNKNVSKAYSSFTSTSTRGSFKVKDVASEHSLNIAKALKKESNLWVTTNGTTSLNKSHPIVDCIANNIKDKDIKTTYNALLSTNSLKPNLILPLLNSSARFIQADGSLKSYLAFEMFYSQLLDVNLEDLKNPDPETDVANPLNGADLNKSITPAKIENTEDPHAGHNHD